MKTIQDYEAEMRELIAQKSKLDDEQARIHWLQIKKDEEMNRLSEAFLKAFPDERPIQ